MPRVFVLKVLAADCSTACSVRADVAAVVVIPAAIPAWQLQRAAHPVADVMQVVLRHLVVSPQLLAATLDVNPPVVHPPRADVILAVPPHLAADADHLAAAADCSPSCSATIRVVEAVAASPLAELRLRADATPDVLQLLAATLPPVAVQLEPAVNPLVVHLHHAGAMMVVQPHLAVDADHLAVADY